MKRDASTSSAASDGKATSVESDLLQRQSQLKNAASVEASSRQLEFARRKDLGDAPSSHVILLGADRVLRWWWEPPQGYKARLDLDVSRRDVPAAYKGRLPRDLPPASDIAIAMPRGVMIRRASTHLRWYAKHGVCPICGSMPAVPLDHSRESANYDCHCTSRHQESSEHGGFHGGYRPREIDMILRWDRETQQSVKATMSKRAAAAGQRNLVSDRPSSPVTGDASTVDAKTVAASSAMVGSRHSLVAGASGAG